MLSHFEDVDGCPPVQLTIYSAITSNLPIKPTTFFQSSPETDIRRFIAIRIRNRFDFDLAVVPTLARLDRKLVVRASDLWLKGC